MLAIVAAMAHELALIRKKMDSDTQIQLRPGVIWHGHLAAVEVLLIQSGMGAPAMQAAIEFACRHYPISRILNVGYAGGTHPALHLGDLVIPETICDAETRETWPVNADMASLATRFCEDHHLRFHRGTVACVHAAIESPHEKAYWGTQFEANAVDMESAGVARVANALGIPFSVVRSIVDPLDMALPHFPLPTVEKGVVRPMLLAAHLLKNPRQLLLLPKLHYASTRAREAITEACLGICERLG